MRFVKYFIGVLDSLDIYFLLSFIIYDIFIVMIPNHSFLYSCVQLRYLVKHEHNSEGRLSKAPLNRSRGL